MYFAKWSFKDTNIYQGGKPRTLRVADRNEVEVACPSQGLSAPPTGVGKSGLLESELIFYIHSRVYKKMSCRRSREDTSY